MIYRPPFAGGFFLETHMDEFKPNFRFDAEEARRKADRADRLVGIAAVLIVVGWVGLLAWGLL